MNQGYLLEQPNILLRILILLFPITLITVKIVGNLILLILAIIGIYLFLIGKGNPFREKELRFLSYSTTGYFFVVMLSMFLADGFDINISHLGRKLHFLFAPFIALTLNKVFINHKDLICSMKYGLLLVGMITLVQLFLGFDRPSGMFNANIFGDIVVTMIFLSASSYFTETKREKKFTVVAASFGLLALILSSSRGSWVAFIFLSGIFILLNKSYITFTLKRGIINFLRVLALLIVILNIPFYNDIPNGEKGRSTISSKILKTYDAITNWKNDNSYFSSSSLRLEMWRSSIPAYFDAPFFGHGYRNANDVVSKYAKNFNNVISNFTHLHNEYITNLVSIGFVGFLVFLNMLFTPMRIFIYSKKLKMNQPMIDMGILLCCSYATVGFTHIIFGEEHVNAFFIFFISFLLPRVLKAKKPTKNPQGLV